jgi:hypothetical protein
MSRPRSENRRSQRLDPFVVACTVVQGERRVRGFLTDLSPRGARIACKESAPADGSAVVIEVRFARGEPLARLPGRVRWSKRPDDPRGLFGVVFERPSAEDRRLVDSAIEAFRSAAELVS